MQRQDQNSNVYKKKGQNYTVSKDNIRIPTFERISSELQCLEIRPEFQCLEEYVEKSNVHENTARIPMFERIR